MYRDIAEESCLNKAESVALIRIAKEVDQLQGQIDKLVEGQQAKTIAGSGGKVNDGTIC